MTTERRIVSIQINSAAPVEGNYGPQWQLELQWPWSQYTSRSWIDRTGDTPPRYGERNVEVQRGNLINEEKGNADWNYKWYIVDMNPSAPPTNGVPTAGEAEQLKTVGVSERQDTSVSVGPTTPETRFQPKQPTEATMMADHPSKRRSIERQKSIELALLYADNVDSAKPLAEDIYSWISKPPESAAMPPESNAGPPSDQLDQETAMQAEQDARSGDNVEPPIASKGEEPSTEVPW